MSALLFHRGATLLRKGFSTFLSLPECGPEISDLIVGFDSNTLGRLPVRKEDVLREFRNQNNSQASKIVQRLSAEDGYLIEEEVDSILIQSHIEMQRVSEEFQHGARVLDSGIFSETSCGRKSLRGI